MANLEGKLLKKVQKTSLTYDLLAPNDKIMVAVSGGKDSYTLLQLLISLKKKLPFPIELIAVHLDQKQPNYDGRPLQEYLADLSVPFEILAEDTYSVVLEHTEEGDTYCSICSRLRRGILYTAAERLGCNKIALGHHRDDALETFLMNFFYAGKMQAMPAKYRTDDDRFDVIRPMIECSEAQIAEFATEVGFPIIPCNLCGSQPGGTKRDAMHTLISEIEAQHPHVRAVMLNALRNVRPTHLLDQDVMEAWSVRPESIRPDPPAKKTIQHAVATPAVTSVNPRLKVIP
ncbi:MAG: tRNA 2-thiocytidine(32) synthetase TtcA [Myxococcota bacterium]|nr:tRNA 2-thiocytidine(32) synthetase TtcA [Myxococcota bacterium]